MTRFLELTHVDIVLRDQLYHYGGEYGVRDHALVESAVATPRATFGGGLLHRTILAVFSCLG